MKYAGSIPFDPDKVGDYHFKQLQAFCKHRGLPANGKKVDIIARLLRFHATAHQTVVQTSKEESVDNDMPSEKEADDDATEVLVSALDWRFASPLNHFYERTFPGQDMECALRLEGLFQQLEIAGTNCCMGVKLFHTTDRLVMPTYGFGNMSLLAQAEADIPREERDFAHELVMQFPREDCPGTALPPHPQCYPQWATSLMLEMMLAKYQSPSPPITAYDKLPMGDGGLLPPTHQARGTCTLSDFIWVPAEDARWPPVLDLHGEVTFLLMIGVTADEFAWCEEHSVREFAMRARRVLGDEFGVTHLTRQSLLVSHPGEFHGG